VGFRAFWLPVTPLLLGALLLVGCGSSQTTDTRSDYQSLYERREYRKAYDEAVAVAGGTTGLDRDRAALIAGLAAAALEPPREADAERWLGPLVENQDTRVSGVASATLGMFAQRKSNHSKAVDLLTNSVNKLSGEDQARAAMFCGDSLVALGKGSDARAMYDRAAGAPVRDRLLKQQIDARVASAKNAGPTPDGSGTFTLQLGAFGDFQRAMAESARLQPKAQAAGLPNPRVVRSAKDGKPLYVVRVGRYPTRAEGETARNKLGATGVVMAASGE